MLPFGLATAPYVFTKLLRPLVKKWRSQGLRVVIYVDDGICVARSVELAARAAQCIREDLQAAGFIVNIEKSD